MKKQILIAVVLGTFTLTGCSRRVVPVKSHARDSVRIEHSVEYIEKIRIDTVRVPIPAQSAQNQTPDSTSHLETDFAASDARINPNGTLYHDLRSKPQNYPVPVPVVETQTRVRSDSTNVQIRIQEVPVPMPLSVWERFWMGVGKIAAGAGVILVVWKVGTKGR